MTHLIATVAVRTGIAPQFLWQDEHMLAAIVRVIQEQDKDARKH